MLGSFDDGHENDRAGDHADLAARLDQGECDEPLNEPGMTATARDGS